MVKIGWLPRKCDTRLYKESNSAEHDGERQGQEAILYLARVMSTWSVRYRTLAHAQLIVCWRARFETLYSDG